MRTIKKVVLGFENCTVADITNGIGYLYIGDISRKIYTVAQGHIPEHIVAKKVAIALCKNGEYGIDRADGKDFFDHILAHNDIVDLCITYSDGVTESIYVEYDEERKYGPNKNQITKLTDNGDLLIAIGEHNGEENIEEFFPVNINEINLEHFLPEEVVAKRRIENLGWHILEASENMTICLRDDIIIKIDKENAYLYENNVEKIVVRGKQFYDLCSISLYITKFQREPLENSLDPGEPINDNGNITIPIGWIGFLQEAKLTYPEKEPEKGTLLLHDNMDGNEISLPCSLLNELNWIFPSNCGR